MPSSPFAPFQSLAEQLLVLLPESTDGAHDQAHLIRVWKNVLNLMKTEGGDGELLLAATLLHDGVPMPKNDPRRALASRLAATQARRILGELHWKASRIGAVAHAIEAHSFSAGITPQTLEARILQDADRLDALGALGVARCFYTAGQMGSALYDIEDPKAARRTLDDQRFALDHFPAKLFGLAEGFQTPAGARLAAVRRERLVAFMTDLLAETGEETGEKDNETPSR